MIVKLFSRNLESYLAFRGRLPGFYCPAAVEQRLYVALDSFHDSEWHLGAAVNALEIPRVEREFLEWLRRCTLSGSAFTQSLPQRWR